MVPRLSTLLQILALCLLLTLVGCDDAEVSTAPPQGSRLSSLSVEPGSLQLAKGTTETLKVLGHYEDGSVQDLTSAVSWAPADTVAIFPDGTVKALTPGDIELRASIDSLSTTLPIAVTDATLTALQLEEPETEALLEGEAHAYRVVGLFSDGTQQEVTSQATFHVSDPSLAQIAPTGSLQAQKSGEATLQASYANLSAQSTIRIQAAKSLTRITLSPSSANFPKGVTQSFKATGVYSDGTTQDLTTLATWRSSNTSICTVTQGRASGLRAGSASVSATYGGRTASASTTVNSSTLSSLSLTPGQSLAAGTTQQLKLTARYSNGISYDVTNIATFRSASPSVASVTTTGTTRGLVKGLATGSSAITASFSGRSAQTTVRVTAPTVTRLTLDPASVSLPRGLTRQLVATAHFSDNTSRDVTNQATFSSSASSVASVSTLPPRGLVTAKTNGSATLTATYSGRSATSRVTVVNATLSSLRFEPASASIAAGTSTRFLIRAIYSDNSQQDVTANAALTVQSPVVAELTSLAGQVKGRTSGSTRVNATYGGRTASATLTVTPAVLTRIDITPANASFPKGTHQQFRATGLYSDQSTQDLTRSVAWSAQAPAVLAIDDKGEGLGLAVGSTQVSASQGSIRGSVTATVSSAVLTGLTLDPPTSSVPSGLSQTLVATALYSDGTSRDVTGETSFLSDDDNVATVSNDAPRGVVRANAPGTTTITARYDGRTARSQIRVADPVLTSLAFIPASASIPAGTTQTFALMAGYSDGSQYDVVPDATLTLGDESVATFTATPGVLKGLVSGRTSVTAHYGTLSAEAQLQVTAAELVKVEVTPAEASFPKGLTQAYTASGTYTDQTTQDLTALVSWSVEDRLTCSVTSQGEVKGLAVGRTQIRAILEGKKGEARATVTAAVPTLLTLSPSSASLPHGSSGQLTAMMTFSDDETQDVTAETTFVSDAPLVVSVTTSGERGVVTARAASGSATITATCLELEGTASVTALPAIPTAMRVTPEEPFSAPDTQRQFRAFATYTDGVEREVTEMATWTSNSTSAEVSASGLVSVGGQHGNDVELTAALTEWSLQAKAKLYIRAFYLRKADGPSLEVFRVDPANANLVLVSTKTFASSSSLQIAVDATGRYVYVPLRSVDGVGGFRLEPNGTLTALPGSPYAGSEYFHCIVSPDQKTLFVTGRSQSSLSNTPIYGYPIQADGSLGERLIAANTMKHPENMFVDPLGRAIYVAGSISPVYSFTPNDDHTLTMSTTPPVQGEVMAIHPSGLFGASDGFNTLLRLVTVDPTTGVATQGSSQSSDQYHERASTYSPDGKFLHLITVNPTVVRTYSVDQSTGALTPIPGSPLALSNDSAFCLQNLPGTNFIMVVNAAAGSALLEREPSTGVVTLRRTISGTGWSGIPTP